MHDHGCLFLFVFALKIVFLVSAQKSPGGAHGPLGDTCRVRHFMGSTQKSPNGNNSLSGNVSVVALAGFYVLAGFYDVLYFL